MAKLTNETRSAILSARAKIRKAATVLGNAHAAGDVTVPKHVIAKLQGLEKWANDSLAPAQAKSRKAA